MTKTTIVHALLLEDSAIDAELLERHLLRAGRHFDLWRASGRQSFMEAMEQGGFDIILADYSLPDFDGLTALKIAKSRYPDVRVSWVRSSPPMR